MNTTIEILRRVVLDAEAFLTNPESEPIATDAEWRLASDHDMWRCTADAILSDTLTDTEYDAVRDVASGILRIWQIRCDRGESLRNIIGIGSCAKTAQIINQNAKI